MANIFSRYTPGGAETVTEAMPAGAAGGGLDLNMLNSILASREAERQQDRAMALSAMRQPALTRGAGRAAGGRAVTRRGMYSSGSGGGAMAPRAKHAYVTNIKGGPQVMGGMVRSSAGASPGNTFYAGRWDEDEGQGGVSFAGLPDNSGTPAIAAAAEDPADRAMRLNNNVNLGPRADYMPSIERAARQQESRERRTTSRGRR